VGLKDALDGCERILNDEFSAAPEKALYMIGSIEEAVTRLKSVRDDESGDSPGEAEGKGGGTPESSRNGKTASPPGEGAA
jgi:F-type H+-transporting ATPase subunit beta